MSYRGFACEKNPKPLLLPPAAAGVSLPAAAGLGDAANRLAAGEGFGGVAGDAAVAAAGEKLSLPGSLADAAAGVLNPAAAAAAAAFSPAGWPGKLKPTEGAAAAAAAVPAAADICSGDGGRGGDTTAAAATAARAADLLPLRVLDGSGVATVVRTRGFAPLPDAAADAEPLLALLLSSEASCRHAALLVALLLPLTADPPSTRAPEPPGVTLLRCPDLAAEEPGVTQCSLPVLSRWLLLGWPDRCCWLLGVLTAEPNPTPPAAAPVQVLVNEPALTPAAALLGVRRPIAAGE
jgi:hypothetical protein